MAQKIESAQQLNAPIQAGPGGTHGSYAIVGGIQYAWGLNLIAAAGTTLTFGRPFGAAPVIVCTTQDPSEQTAWVTSRSASQMTLKQKYTGANLGVNWIAIGPA